MRKSKNQDCALLVALLAALATGASAGAQSDGLGNSQPGGGLRGPQDIINSTNARDAYGNLRPVDNSGAAASSEAGSIRPFTAGPSGNYPDMGGAQIPYQAPGAYAGAQGGYPPGVSGGYPPGVSGGYPPGVSGGYPPGVSGGYPPGVSGGYPPGASGGYPGAPVGNTGYAPPGSGQPGSYSSKHHHHHKNQSRYASAPTSATYPGAPPGAPNMSGPPGAAYTPPHKGNSSLAGAAIGVPDRAGKTAVGVSGKAVKEVLKAIF